MRFLLKFFLCIIRSIEGKCLFCGCHNSISAIVKFYIFAIIMASILLWTDIIFMQIPYICPVQTVACCLMLITIAFLRSHPKVSDICKFLIQEHSHTKSRKIRELSIFCGLNICVYFSCRIYCPCNRHIKNLLHCLCHNGSMTCNLHTMFSLHNLCRIGSCISLIIVGFPPFRFDVHIVICWGSPDI